MNRKIEARIQALESRAAALARKNLEYLWIENEAGADEDFEAPPGSVVVEDYYQHGGSYSTKNRIAIDANDLGRIFEADTGLVIGRITKLPDEQGNLSLEFPKEKAVGSNPQSGRCDPPPGCESQR